VNFILSEHELRPTQAPGFVFVFPFNKAGSADDNFVSSPPNQSCRIYTVTYREGDGRVYQRL